MNRDRSAKGHSAWLAGLLAAFLFIGFDTLPAAASASPPETTSHPPSATVQIGDIGNRAHVSLRIGDTLTVLLPGNVTTGYGWQVIANSDAVLAPGARRRTQEEALSALRAAYRTRNNITARLEAVIPQVRSTVHHMLFDESGDTTEDSREQTTSEPVAIR